MNKRHLVLYLGALLVLFFILEFGVRVIHRDTSHPILAKWPVLALYPNINRSGRNFHFGS